MKAATEIKNARIQRCKEANNDQRYRMRYCEACEIPVGSFPLHQWKKFRVCKKCGQPVHQQEIESVEEPTEITFSEANLLFRVGKIKLKKLMDSGELTHRRGPNGLGGKPILLVESELSERFERR